MRGIALFLLNTLIAGSTQAAGVVLTLQTPKPDQGEYFIAVHDNAATFPKGKPAHATRTPVDGEQQRVRIQLPEGRYAVSLYQDLNDNGELDTNLLGAPVEPVGFSRNARGSLGPPEFGAAAFEVDDTHAEFDIRLRE